MTSTGGGYDYCFIDTPPDIVICNICHFTSRDPYLSECCGHVFCKSCVERVKARRTTTICPMCRNEDFKVFVNKQLDRITKGLRVSCTNKDKGCKWQGEMNDIEAHLGNSDGCPFESIKCVNKCGIMLQRQNLTNHIEYKCPCRTVHCQFCHTANEWQFIEGKHKNQCHKFPLACPNHCDIGSVPREDLIEHMKVCPLELVRCEFYNIGCTDMMPCQDLTQHNADNLHKHLTLSTCELAKAKEMVSVKQTIENGVAETKGEFISIKKDIAQFKGEFVQKLNCMERQLTTLTKIATSQQETISKLTEKLDKLSRTVNDSKPLDFQPTDSSEDEESHKFIPVKKTVKAKPRHASVFMTKW